RRAAAGADDRFAKLQRAPIDAQCRRPGALGFSEVDVYPRTLEPLCRIVLANPHPQPPQALHSGRKIEGPLLAARLAELAAVTGIVGGSCGANQRFAGHAPEIETIAPQEMPLN